MIRLIYKNTLLKIKKSFGRYISMFIIIMVGVGFYSGIQASAPDISKLADSYYRSHSLMDFKIVSSMGLTEEDVFALKSLPEVNDVIPSFSLDAIDKDKAIRIHALEEKVNTVNLTDGRLPQSDKECVADSKNFNIGDKISITSNVADKMKNTEFTVVGLTESVLYISEDYGSTTVGSGKLMSFIFINKDNFTMDAYTEIYVTAKDTQKAATYSGEYKDIISRLKDKLVQIKPEREKSRYEKIYSEANDKINENLSKLQKEKQNGEIKLSDAKKELNSNTTKLKEAKDELVSNEAKLEDTITTKNSEFKEAKSKIADGWKEIDQTLQAVGVSKGEVEVKTNELNFALQKMKSQLAELSASDPQYTQLNTTIREYSAKLEGIKNLKEAINTLTAQEKQLNDGIVTFNSEIAKAKNEIEKGKLEIQVNEKKINDGYKEYEENQSKFIKEIADAERKLQNAREDLLKVEHPKWYISDRDAAVGYSELGDSINMITSVAAVFPFFFILIVVLMTSNSMTRMITEERSELGTLTSLGYHDKSIIYTYLLYVLSASGLGALIGFFVGCAVIPPLIYLNFQYILPPLVIHYSMVSFIIILAVTLIFMTFVTVVGCYKELKEKPATLMRPLPPKHGQKILLERVGFIWENLSFTWKVTMRNMFRYKKRGLMTILGVAGCTSLLVVGFGLKDSMDGVVLKQYGDIFRYSNMIILKEETLSISGDLDKLLESEQIKNPLLIRQSAYQCEKEDQSIDAFLIVPKDNALFNEYYHLKSTIDKKDISMSDGGVVITQRIAEKFNVGKGDNISVKDADNKVYNLPVTNIAENYISNYIYIEPSLYTKLFGEATSYNAIVSIHSGDEKAIAEKLIDSGLILNTIFSDDIINKAVDNNDSLNGIIVLLVVVASILAFIVLYNLTAINISERTREIATLKVLGFRDAETNAYIYREALLLSLFSIGIGVILGIFLHRFVLDIIETDVSVLLKKIKWLSFIFSALLTLVFSLVMQVITYLKLKSINMIESLKSVE